jgi:hypothetical protein
MPKSQHRYIVRASDLNSWEYCHRNWWLRRVAGVEPSAEAQGRMDAGTRRHAAHGRGVVLAGLLWRAGVALLAGGILAGGVWWILTMMGH